MIKMNKNKKIIIGILIVALVLGLAFGGSMATATDNIQPELPEQSLPTVPDDDTPDDDTGDNNDTTETMPVFKNAYKLWEYSYDIFNVTLYYFGSKTEAQMFLESSSAFLFYFAKNLIICLLIKSRLSFARRTFLRTTS